MPEVAQKKPALKSSTKVKVKNISKGPVFTSEGIIKEGQTGECTLAEAKSYNKKLEML